MHRLTYPRNRAGGKALSRVGSWGGVRLRVAQFLANLWQGPLRRGRGTRAGVTVPAACDRPRLAPLMPCGLHGAAEENEHGAWTATMGAATVGLWGVGGPRGARHLCQLVVQSIRRPAPTSPGHSGPLL